MAQKWHTVLEVLEGLVALELVLEERLGDAVAHHLKGHGHTREEMRDDAGLSDRISATLAVLVG